ncbi:winged helix-turn-helix domain-containing protein [Bordetella bronchiseptica]|uniref:winged helix-turn-helix domain-containing protein n=1 Tax=Bordetella bronchiseptica TaxID=518 RepID=UPI0004598CF2|nr:winged helix-turn-helix domain-containing protein [Bordetella bronchiseptica]KCV54012.1 transcriptional regulatory protein, C-terminal domain protein [Bordetella bronchiseptica 7E71]
MSIPSVRYADLVFQSDLRAATRDDGARLSLTRQERALILQLTERPHQLITRRQLLEGLGDLAGELSERNIDYLVNRLRKRLGDNARTPRFIATQYGEGYIWVADPIAVEPVSAFLLIGPVYGLGDSAHAAAVVKRLGGHIGQALHGSRKVLCLPQWRFEPETASHIAHSLEISLLPEDGQLHMALVLKDGRSNTPIRPFRLTVPLGAENAELAAFAQSLADAIWAHAALPGGEPSNPTDRPLLLRLHDAAVLVTGDIESWRHNAQRLRAAHADNPDDPALAVLLALNRYAELIQGPLSPDAPPLTDAQWRGIEDDIEQLALGALARARSEPMLLLGIAKVLCFIDRGYLKLAATLTDEAFEASTAFAAAFTMKALTLACQGEIDRAVDLYDRAIELAETGSQFHIYLLILKGSALLAADRRGEVAQMVAELSAFDPASRGWVGLIFLSPKSKRTPPALAMIPKEAGRRMLTYLHRTTARQFERRHHQKNVLHGLAIHLARVHGADVIPPPLREYFPKRFADAS